MLRTHCRIRHVTGVACLRIGTAWVAKRRTPVTFDLRQEPGAGKPHAGICAGAVSNHRPYRDIPLISALQFRPNPRSRVNLNL